MVSEIKSIHDAVVYLHLKYWIVAKHFYQRLWNQTHVPDLQKLGNVEGEAAVCCV